MNFKKAILTALAGAALFALPLTANATTFANMTGVVNGTTNVRFLVSNGKKKLPALTLALIKGTPTSLGFTAIDNGSNKAAILIPDIELVDKATSIPASVELDSTESVLLKVGRTLSGHILAAIRYPSSTYILAHPGKGTQYAIEGAASINSAWAPTRGKNTGKAVIAASGFAPVEAVFYTYSSGGGTISALPNTAHYGDATVSMPAIQTRFYSYSTNSSIQ